VLLFAVCAALWALPVQAPPTRRHVGTPGADPRPVNHPSDPHLDSVAVSTVLVIAIAVTLGVGAHIAPDLRRSPP